MSFTHGRVCDITEDAVKSWYYGNALKDQPDAKERTYQMLKRICKKAVEDGLLENNPAHCPTSTARKANDMTYQSSQMRNFEPLRTTCPNGAEYFSTPQPCWDYESVKCVHCSDRTSTYPTDVCISATVSIGEKATGGLYAWPRPKQKAPTHGSIFHKASCPCSLNGCERTSDQSRMQCSSKARQVATI